MRKPLPPIFYLLLFSLLYCTTGNAQVFLQQFTPTFSTVTNDTVTDLSYVNTPASSSQFTFIATGTSGTNTIAASGGSLQITENTTGGSWGFVRNENFSSPPLSLKITFDANIIVGATGSQRKWFFYVGSGFTNGLATEANAEIHSGFSIRYANSNFYFAKTLDGAGGETVGDRISDNTNLTFTFVTNNSGYTLSYTAPGGAGEAIANDTWDLWIGNTKVFDEQPATTASQSIEQIKFGDFITSSAGRANWTLDNFMVQDLTTILPVKLEYFNGKRSSAGNAISWKVNCLATSAVMEIERAHDKINFNSISSVTATRSRCNQPFIFTDAKPLKGNNYYRLKMTSIDGHISYSSIVTISNGDKRSELIGLYPSMVTNETYLNIIADKRTTISARITDMNGKLIRTSSFIVAEGDNLLKIDCTAIPSGAYNFTGFTEGMEPKTIRFVKL